MDGLILGPYPKPIRCVIRGKLRKRVWINVGDIVLVALRDFEDGKCDIELKYTTDEIHRLRGIEQLHDSDDPGIPDAEESGFVFDTI